MTAEPRPWLILNHTTMRVASRTLCKHINRAKERVGKSAAATCKMREDIFLKKFVVREGAEGNCDVGASEMRWKATGHKQYANTEQT